MNTSSFVLTFLKSQRVSRGLTQSQLAQKSKVSLQNIQIIEAGKGNPSLDTLLRLCVALDIEISLEEKSFNWDELIVFGLPLFSANRSTKVNRFLINQDSFQELMLRAGHSLDQASPETLVDYDRKKLAFESLLLAVQTHFPSFYKKKLKKVEPHFPKKITGHHLKLKRICLEGLAKFL